MDCEQDRGGDPLISPEHRDEIRTRMTELLYRLVVQKQACAQARKGMSLSKNMASRYLNALLADNVIARANNGTPTYYTAGPAIIRWSGDLKKLTGSTIEPAPSDGEACKEGSIIEPCPSDGETCKGSIMSSTIERPPSDGEACKEGSTIERIVELSRSSNEASQARSPASVHAPQGQPAPSKNEPQNAGNSPCEKAVLSYEANCARGKPAKNRNSQQPERGVGGGAGAAEGLPGATIQSLLRHYLTQVGEVYPHHVFFDFEIEAWNGPGYAAHRGIKLLQSWGPRTRRKPAYAKSVPHSTSTSKQWKFSFDYEDQQITVMIYHKRGRPTKGRFNLHVGLCGVESIQSELRNWVKKANEIANAFCRKINGGATKATLDERNLEIEFAMPNDLVEGGHHVQNADSEHYTDSTLPDKLAHSFGGDATAVGSRSANAAQIVNHLLSTDEMIAEVKKSIKAIAITQDMIFKLADRVTDENNALKLELNELRKEKDELKAELATVKAENEGLKSSMREMMQMQRESMQMQKDFYAEMRAEQQYKPQGPKGPDGGIYQ